MNEERMDVVLEEAWEDEGQNYGAPDETQRSGFGGETTPAGVFRGQPPQAALRPRWTSTEMNEALPLGEDERCGGCEDDEGVVGADNTEQAQGEETAAQEAPAQSEVPAAQSEVPKVLKGEPGKEHPLLTRARENARMQEMQRFLNTYPEVKANDIPRGVWEQVAKGVPLVSAYTMHENQQLKMQLAAERQNRLNRQRTPGALGSHSGGELDELDRMWAEED